MIKNIWKTVKVYCGSDHDELTELEVEQGMYQLFYACPRYKRENRGDNERACNNRISIDDYEGMIKHVSDLLEEAELNGSMLNLTNYTWKRKGITFKIIEHTKDKIAITMLNKTAMKK